MSDTETPAVWEMAVLHRIFRNNLRAVAWLAPRVRTGDDPHCRAVIGHLRRILDLLHEHHENEDAFIWPLLLQRCPIEADQVHRMETQHARVAELDREVRTAADTWESNGGPGLAQRLADAVVDLLAALEEHLDEEESIVIPLLAQHITAHEWNAVGERARSQATPADLTIMLGMLLDVATAKEAATFLAALPAPARLIYRLHGRRQYRRYMTAVFGLDHPASPVTATPTARSQA